MQHPRGDSLAELLDEVAQAPISDVVVAVLGRCLATILGDSMCTGSPTADSTAPGPTPVMIVPCFWLGGDFQPFQQPSPWGPPRHRLTAASRCRRWLDPRAAGGVRLPATPPPRR